MSIDRLGDGNSTHPDPITQLQIFLEEAVLHRLVLASNSGATIAGNAFSKVIFVGHSYGSILGGYIAADYPSDFAAMILTGFGDNVAPAAAGINQTVLYPASKYARRFTGLPLGYMIMPSRDGRRNYFYGPPSSFDQRILLVEFNTEDDLGLGEVFSLGAGLKTASAYWTNLHNYWRGGRCLLLQCSVCNSI